MLGGDDIAPDDDQFNLSLHGVRYELSAFFGDTLTAIRWGRAHRFSGAPRSGCASMLIPQGFKVHDEAPAASRSPAPSR